MLDDFIKIDQHFQKSINLQLDFMNPEKIKAFIPTADTNVMLRYYINILLGNKQEYANILIGAYGKGKSHIILVVLYLMSKERDKKIVDGLLLKIKKIDVETYKLIKEFINSEKYFFPVIISSTRSDFNGALLSALDRGMRDHNIKISLITEYNEALNRIENWKKSYPDTYQQFLNLLKKEHLGERTFIANLIKYDEVTLKRFKNIHKMLFAGTEFHVENQLDAVDYYKMVNRILCRKNGYTGMFVVFDEFGKFIESRDEKNVTNDIKIIQDLCELANASDNRGLMNFTLIMHKHVMEYSERVSDKVKNAFRGIEGRVEEKYYYTNLQSNYDLMSNVVIKRQKDYEEYCKQEKIAQLFDQCQYLPCFSLYFNKKIFKTKIVKAIFPLNPISAYLLFNINEKIAQNERTLFTFLAKEGENTLVNYIKGNTELLNPAIIYDYFYSTFKQEKDNYYVKKYFIKANNALETCNENAEKDFLKTVALIKMVNKPSEIETSIKTLALALNKTKNETEEIAQKCFSKLLLIERKNQTVDFKASIDIDVKNLVKKKTANLPLNADLEYLNQISKNKFEIPKFYNTKMKMTRYYYKFYIYAKDFLKVNNLKDYLQVQADGYVLTLIDIQEDEIELIHLKMKKMKDENVIVRYNLNAFNILPLLKTMQAIESLEEESDIKNNKEALYEFNEYYDDEYAELIKHLEEDYTPRNKECCVIAKGKEIFLNGKRSWNRQLGEVLEDYYPKTPIVNLELLNKQNVVGVYKKATQNVVSNILLNSVKFEPSNTSPEGTIVRCVLQDTGILKDQPNTVMAEVLQFINEFLNKCRDKPQSIAYLYKHLQRPPFGLRKWLIPIFFAFEIQQFKGNKIIYNQNYEVPYTGETFIRITEKPENYTLLVEKPTSEVYEYLEGIKTVFNAKTIKYKDLTEAMQQWYNELPMICKMAITEDQEIATTARKKFKREITRFDINPHDFIFKKIPEIFKSSYEELPEMFRQLKYELLNYRQTYKQNIEDYIVKTLGYDNSNSLKSVLIDWYNEKKPNIEYRILDNTEKQFVKILEAIQNKGKENLVEEICFAFTGLFFNDWAINTQEVFKKQFSRICITFNESQKEKESIQKIIITRNGKSFERKYAETLDPTTELLENVIEEAFSDFGESISNEEKVALLVRMIQKIGNEA